MFLSHIFLFKLLCKYLKIYELLRNQVKVITFGLSVKDIFLWDLITTILKQKH